MKNGERTMDKKYCVTYYCSDNDRVLTKTCKTFEELETFRSFLSRHTGIDELYSIEFTLVKVSSGLCVYDMRKV